MALRRMFSKTITNSSKFLMMPNSSQNLYFHLGMNADDDGFCEHFTIMRMTESKPDDLKILQAKNFIRVFDDKVLVILDWKENNYLRSDRYTASKYLEIYKNEIKQISCQPDGIPDVNQEGDNVDTQDRIGKDRIGKDRIGKDRITKKPTASPIQEKPEYINLATLLYTEHIKHDDNFLSGKDFDRTINSWAKDIRLLIEKDNRNYELVQKVIIWCQEWPGKGEFSWRFNILSGAALRRSFDKLLGGLYQYMPKHKKQEEEKFEDMPDWKKALMEWAKKE